MGTHFVVASLTLTLTLTLLLLSLSPALTTTEDDPVLDFLGAPLEAGVEYYILLWGRAGALTTAPKPHLGPCPLYVVENSNPDLGIAKPMTFTPKDSSQTQIQVASDIRINSGPASECGESFWRLSVNLDKDRHEVISNGNHPSTPILFQIRKGGDEGGYVISRCSHDDHGIPGDNCEDLRSFVEYSKFKVLGLPDSTTDILPLHVHFMKKTDALPLNIINTAAAF